MVCQHLVCRMPIELPRRKKCVRVVTRIIIVFVNNSSPGFTPVGHIVRPRIYAAFSGGCSIRISDEEYLSAVELAKTASVVLLPRSALNNGNHPGASIWSIQWASVSRNAGA